MNRLKDIFNKRLDYIKKAVVNDNNRKKLMFTGLNIVLFFVCLTMSVVNVFTKEYTLMYSTIVFGSVCLINFLLMFTKMNKNILYLCFTLEAFALLCFYFITGIPEGFSALWVCLIPSFALLFFGGKKGSLFCLGELIVMIVLFWTPWGQSLFHYQYTKSFLLRFPFLYVAIYLLSLFVEFIRDQTQRQLIQSEEKYHYLYRHDALTGLYNRYGFNETIEKAFENNKIDKISVIIMDIDNFKSINDKYGHLAGDEVLKSIASVPTSVMCEHCNFCRWGGEEFMVLMQCDHDPLVMAEKIRKKVEDNPIIYDKQTINVTISLGVAIVTDMKNISINDIIIKADDCLYKSKMNGKNRVTSVTI